MSLSKQHFEHMAEHIARSTKEGSPERKAALEMAHSLGRTFNPRYDAGRMEAAVHGLSTGTHTVGDSGRIKRVSGSSGVKKLSASFQEGDRLGRTGKDYKTDPQRFPKTAAFLRATGAGNLVDDEPRDDRGRWTK